MNFHISLQNPGSNSKILGALQNSGSNSQTLKAATPPSLSYSPEEKTNGFSTRFLAGQKIQNC